MITQLRKNDDDNDDGGEDNCDINGDDDDIDDGDDVVPANSDKPARRLKDEEARHQLFKSTLNVVI